MFRLCKLSSRAFENGLVNNSPASKIGVQYRKYSTPNGSFDFTKTFDSLDSTSFKTMEKILDILHDAEESAEDVWKSRKGTGGQLSYDTKLGTELGNELFHYNIMRIVGESTLATERGYQVNGKEFDSFCNELSMRFSHNKDSFFRVPEINLDSSLNPFQAIARYFVENDSRCLQKLRNEIFRLSSDIITTPIKKTSYDFPNVKLPQTFRRGESTLFTIKKGFNIKDHNMNLLPFLMKDENVISAVITKFQRKNNLTINNPDTILRLMELQEAQGRKIFSFLSKKAFFKNEVLRFEVVNAISDNKEIKSVIAHHSKLPERLSSYRIHKSATNRFFNKVDLSESDIMTLLANQCERVLSIFYASNPSDCEKWITSMLLTINKNPYTIDPSITKDAVQYFHHLMNSSSFTTNTSFWNTK